MQFLNRYISITITWLRYAIFKHVYTFWVLCNYNLDKIYMQFSDRHILILSGY